ncbi:MAG: hypothetical protein ACOCXQ_00050 [Patescibacteria group bacterium]
MENKTPLILGIAAVAVIGIAAFIFTGSPNSDSTSPGEANQTSGSMPGDSMDEEDAAMEGEEEMTEDSSYIDGTYNADGTYTSPAGEEDVDVTITIADGLIESVESSVNAENEISVKHQTAFANNIESEIVGRSLDEVDLDVVAGSSLTPIGFMNALEQIKQDARS